jgi:hypothetical protein
MGDWTGTVPSFTAGTVLPASDLQTLADELTAVAAAWTSWTPTLTNLTLGNGTLAAAYRRVGKTGDLRFAFTLGSTSAVGTNPQFSLPFTLNSTIASSGLQLIGPATLVDSGTARRMGAIQADTSTTVSIIQINATPAVASITATSPWTWTTGDMLMCNLSGLELA